MSTIEEIETPSEHDKDITMSNNQHYEQAPTCHDQTSTCPGQSATCHDQAPTCHGQSATCHDQDSTCPDKTTTCHDQAPGSPVQDPTYHYPAPTSPDQVPSCHDKAPSCPEQFLSPRDQMRTYPDMNHISQTSSSHNYIPPSPDKIPSSGGQTPLSHDQAPTSQGHAPTTQEHTPSSQDSPHAFLNQVPNSLDHARNSRGRSSTGIKALVSFASPAAVLAKPIPRSISLSNVNRSGSPITSRKISLPARHRETSQVPGSPLNRSGTLQLKAASKCNDKISKWDVPGSKQESRNEDFCRESESAASRDENMSPILSRNSSQRRRKMSTAIPPSRSGVLIRSASPLFHVDSETGSKISASNNVESTPGTSCEQRKVSTGSKSGEASAHQGFDMLRSAFRRRTPPSDGEEDNNLANFVNKVLHVQKFYKKTSTKKPRDEFLEKFTYLPEDNRLPRRTSNQQMKNHVPSTSSTQSTGSDESMEEEYYPFIFDPCGYMYLIWLAFVSIAVTYNYWLIIIRIALPHLQQNNIIVFLVLDYIMDGIYILDIAAMFRTGYMRNGEIVDDLKLLRKYYMSTWGFYFDVMAIIPLDFFYFLVGFNAALRLGRLFKAHRVLLFTERVETASGNPKIFNLIKLIHYLFLIINWVGCFYLMMSKSIGLGKEIWVYPALIGDWAGDGRQLIYSFFWSTMTMTTIGGVPRPLSTETMAINIVMTLAGIIIFATIVGQASDMIINMRMARMNFQKKVDDMKFYIASNNVPPHLQQRVIQWFDYLWTMKKDMQEEEILNSLPDKFKTEIAIHVHLKTLRKVKIFEQCEPGFLRELVLKLKPQLCSPGDYVCHKGEVGKDMYIVNQGTLEVVADEGKVLCRLEAGSHFGEISILDLHGVGNRRTASIRSVGFSDLFRLSKSDLQEVFTDFPDAKMKLERIARHTLLGDKTRNAKLPLTKDTQNDPRYWLTAEYDELRKHLAKLEYNKKVKRLTMVLRKAKQMREREIINRFNRRNKCTRDPIMTLKQASLKRNGAPLTDQETQVAFQVAVEKYRMTRAARSDSSSLSSLAFESPNTRAVAEQLNPPNLSDVKPSDVIHDEHDVITQKTASDASEEIINEVCEQCDGSSKDDVETINRDVANDIIDGQDDVIPIDDDDLFEECLTDDVKEDVLMEDGGREIHEERLKYRKIYSDLSDDQLFSDEDRQVAKMLSFLQNLVPVPEYLQRCDHVHDDIDVTRSYDDIENRDYEAYDMKDDDVPLIPRPRAVVFNHLTVYPDGYQKPIVIKDPPSRCTDNREQGWNQHEENPKTTESCCVPLSNCNGYQKSSQDDEISDYQLQTSKSFNGFLKSSLDDETHGTFPSRSTKRFKGYEKVQWNSEESLSSPFWFRNQHVENQESEGSQGICDNPRDNGAHKGVEDPLEKIQSQIKRAFQPVKWQRKGYSQVSEMDTYVTKTCDDIPALTKESLV